MFVGTPLLAPARLPSNRGGARGSPDLSDEERDRINFDHPESLETELMAQVAPCPLPASPKGSPA